MSEHACVYTYLLVQRELDWFIIFDVFQYHCTGCFGFLHWGSDDSMNYGLCLRLWNYVFVCKSFNVMDLYDVLNDLGGFFVFIFTD